MKTLAVLFLVLLVAGGLTLSYRAYKEKTVADLEVRRARLEEREDETRRRTSATEEARQLAELQAQQTLTEAERKLAEMRQQELAAKQQLAAAEAEAMRLNQRLDDLRRQKDATIAAAQATAEQRRIDLAAIAAAQEEAQAKLRSIESEKSQLTTREAAHQAALQRQIELEKLAQERATRSRVSPSH